MSQSREKLRRQSARQQVAEILTAAIEAVEPGMAVRRVLVRDGKWLSVGQRQFNLEELDRVFVVGGGKAGRPMAEAAADVLGEHLTGGLLTVKQGHTNQSWQVRFGGHLIPSRSAQIALPGNLQIIEAGHPIPDAAGLSGARQILQLTSGLTENDLVICLLSGGGSALLTLPVDGVTLDDLQALTDLLLRSGATINELNAVRKHVSQLKGGQLARHIAPAHLACLILSDVVGNPLDTIASGPTAVDPTKFSDAYDIMERYSVLVSAPPRVVAHLRKGISGEIADTPKPGDPILQQVQNLVVADNLLAGQAACERAAQMGYTAHLLTTYLEGEAREVGETCAARAKGLLTDRSWCQRPACLVLGGETTVTVQGRGKGGRNQELALAAALALDGWDEAMVVSLATDGTDGPTDASGAVATGSTLDRARQLGLDAADHLANNDSYPFFSALGDLILTGPTNTNVNDLVFVFAF